MAGQGGGCEEVRVCKVDDLAEGAVRKFQINCRGRSIEGFVVRAAGGFHAYTNSCAHEGWPLDKREASFFTPDGRYLVCSNHGSLYEPQTGRCVAGPCREKSLDRLTLRIVNGEIAVSGVVVEPPPAKT